MNAATTGPHVRRLGAIATLLLACHSPGATPPQAAPEGPALRYHVSLPEHHAQRVHVRLSVDDLDGRPVDLSMPVWTPGSYLVREFARHVTDLDAAAPDGTALPVTKLDKNTWRVDPGAAERLDVSYTLYANELSVRTSHVDGDHAFLSPAGTFLYRHGHQGRPHEVVVDAPEGWGVFTGLPERDGVFVAADYDELVDSPFEIGPHETIAFEVNGVPHRAVMGGAVDLDHDVFAEDLTTLCTEVAAVFGNMPFEDYTFILLFVDSGGGGLEHKNSNVSIGNRWRVTSEDGYRSFLGLLAHEYFHAWNVKRFRPEALGPFDYDRENYTPDLWVAEGITSYIDDLSVLRAGFADGVKGYLADRAKAFRSEAEQPGARRTSLALSSHDAWIKLYRPDENSRNHTVSYYSKGALVALLLDLRIRRETDGAATLADVLRLGWARYTEQGRGFPPTAMQELASEVAGADLSGFFADYVEGTAPLDVDSELAWVGLRLKVSPSKTDRELPEDDEGYKLEPSLGITTGESGGLCRVDTVYEDGVAFAAGVLHDDLILAVDDMRVSRSTLQSRLDKRAGETVTLTLFRGQSLRRVELTPALERLEDWKIVSVDEPTEAHFAAFEAWTGWPHPEAPDEAEADDETDAEPATDDAQATPAG